MRTEFIIVGTTYPIQCTKDTNKEINNQFRDFITRVCRDFQIRHIAEEMSCDGLKDQKADGTIGCEVAQEQRIKHSYLDPDRKMRSELSIDNDMLMNAAFNLDSKDTYFLYLNSLLSGRLNDQRAQALF